MLEKKRIARIFGKTVDPAVVDTLLKDLLQRVPLEPARLEYVLAFVDGRNPDEISVNVGHVADLASEHGAAVHDLLGPLVALAFGTLPVSKSSPGSRESLVKDLHRQLAGKIKIVHGAADGHCGLIGSKHTISNYSFIVPKFDLILVTLCGLKFGQVEEFQQ